MRNYKKINRKHDDYIMRNIVSLTDSPNAKRIISGGEYSKFKLDNYFSDGKTYLQSLNEVNIFPAVIVCAEGIDHKYIEITVKKKIKSF